MNFIKLDYLVKEVVEETKIEWPDPLKTLDDEEYCDDNEYLRW